MSIGFAVAARETWLTFITVFAGCSLILSVTFVGTVIAAQKLGWLEVACR